MCNSRSIFVINQNNIINAGCFDYPSAILCTEQIIKDYAAGKVAFPDKVSQIFDADTQDRINCLPATLTEQKVCGVKWVSVFPSNNSKGLQNLSAVIILSSTETGFPLAFMEATLCSNLRTAAVSAVAAKYLSVKEPEAIGFVGAGQQARFHFGAMLSTFASIKKCYVSSRTRKSEQSFVNSLRNNYPDVEFICCNSDYETAVSNADILISAISGQSPIIKADWIQKGTLYIHIGGWEDEFDVVRKADKIICDNWESVKHRTQTVSRMYKAGLLTDSDLYCDIDELVSQKKVGREKDDEFIYFNAVGLSYVDIALANSIYKVCLKNNEGTFIPLQSENIFS